MDSEMKYKNGYIYEIKKLINLHFLSQGAGILSLETGELDLDREFGTFNRRPSAGLDAE